MTPQVLDFIPRSLEDMDKHTEVVDGHHIMAKKKRQVQIKMWDENRYNFIAKLHNVLLAPDLCDVLFSIIMLVNLGHTFYFKKGLHSVLLQQGEKCSYFTT